MKRDDFSHLNFNLNLKVCAGHCVIKVTLGHKRCNSPE